jgi:DNA-binding NarL/FixJ family response regulator
VVVVQVARLPELIEVLAAGAYGYLLDSMPPEQMARALGHAADRRTALPRSVIEAAAEQLRRDADPGLAGVSTTFTPRERQTLTMLRGGSSTRAIADHLGVTPATVRTYVSAVVRKLGARDRSELVLPAEAEAEQAAPWRFLHEESGHRADVPSPRNVQRRVSPSS